MPCIVQHTPCDIDPTNARLFSANIIYAPIVRVSTYRQWLLKKEILTQESVEDYLKAVRSQRITQVFYLPPSGQMIYEGMVFYDRLVTCSSDAVDRATLEQRRLFSLSQYGHYLFLFKLSIHFARITERVDRAY